MAPAGSIHQPFGTWPAATAVMMAQVLLMMSFRWSCRAIQQRQHSNGRKQRQRQATNDGHVNGPPLASRVLCQVRWVRVLCCRPCLVPASPGALGCCGRSLPFRVEAPAFGV